MTESWGGEIAAVHNGQEYLVDAVRSVHRQGFKPLKTPLWMMGPRMRRRHLLQPGRKRALHLPTRTGPPVTRMTGVRAASGQLVAILDADDLWTERKLEIPAHLRSGDDAIDLLVGYLKPLKGGEEGFGVEPLVQPGAATKSGERSLTLGQWGNA